MLGVSAIQLDHDLGDLNLAALASEGLITVPPSAKYEVPGNDVERAALGYLHANCGHCHNTRAAKPPIPLRLALTIGALGSVKETPIYKTTVGIRTETPKRLEDTTLTTIIVPSDPDASLLRLRMLRRAPESGAMPPVGSEVVDMAGSDAVTAWIRTLAP